MNLELLFALVAAHFLVDFPLQGDFLAKAKNHKAPIPGVPWFLCLMAHATICGGSVYLLTGSLAFGLAETIIHAFTDFLKNDGEFGEGADAFVTDQAIHIAWRFIWWLCVAY